MRRFCFIAFVWVLVASLAAAQDVSLGDAARKARMTKPAAPANQQVYTNDNLPTAGGLGIASLTPSPENNTAQQTTASTAAAAPAPAGSDKATEDARQKVYEAWKTKIDTQKSQISQLERELNVLQREAQIRAAVYYADAGTQLRDPKKYADDVRQSQQDTEAKQKSLADAKQKLDDLQDQARKAGVPASYYE